MTDYSKFKVAELKDLVKERGIASTGLKVKQNYIDALEAHDASNGDGSGDATGRFETLDEGAEAASAAADEEGAAVAVDSPEEMDQTMDTAEQTGSAEVADDSDPAGDARDKVNKRKRRSASEEAVNKKLKTAQESDTAVKTSGSGSGESAPHQEDDVQEEVVAADVLAAPDISMQDVQSTGPPSKHPPTRALYVRELVRPLQPNSLREHLVQIAQSDDGSEASIEAFHLDKLRSHALVLFNSTQAASRARNSLHDQVWPDEPMRKPLWVDYIPDEKVSEFIDTEISRGDMTRWEVVYDSSGLDTDGPVFVSLQEADAQHTGARKASTNTPMSRPQPAASDNATSTFGGHRRQSPDASPGPMVEDTHNPSRSTFDSLDEMYSFTEAKPKIYYQPVKQDLAQSRLDGFERETSRNWNDADADPSAYGEGELRRYTFEDGDKLVDGGADFGLFGRRGRGPYRGGGRGRGGDHYKGGYDRGGYAPRWR